MGVSALHVLGTARLFPDSFVSATDLGGLTRIGLRAENNIAPMPTTGQALAEFIALYGQQFSVMWESLSIARCLDACGVSGTAIAATVNSGLTLYAQKVQEGGTRASGSNHDSWNIKEGLMYPVSLTVEHQGDARIEYAAIPTWDGTNNPIVISQDVAHVTPAADNERFTIGKVTLGGILFDQVSRLQINFGIGAQSQGADSDTWDRFAWIGSINPSLTITGSKKRWQAAAAIPLTGLACTHANTSVYLRKRSAGGTFVADGTAEHIKFTAAGLAVVPQIFEAAGNAPGEVSITIPLNYDGTNNPLVVDTTSAIT